MIRRVRNPNRPRSLWHPWLRINRVLRVMLHTRWSAEAWAQVRVEQAGALAAERDPVRELLQLTGWLREFSGLR